MGKVMVITKRTYEKEKFRNKSNVNKCSGTYHTPKMYEIEKND